MKPLRIAMIGTRGVPATFGGIERAVEETAARLAGAGHEVTVYCRNPYSPNRVPEYRGIKLRYLPALETKHLEAFSHSLLATLDAILRRYDVVHYHALGPSLCSPLARLARLRVVATVHALDFDRAKWGRFARLALRLGAWCSARIPQRTIVVSQQLRAYFLERYGRATTYIPNGVEWIELPIRADGDGTASTPHFLFLGRLVPEKGVHTLIEAYRGVETDVPLIIAGPSSHSDEYVARLRALAADDPRISLVGPVYDRAKAELFARAYTLCQPSMLEGLPIVLLEAMSAGICPIVSDLPEHLEVVGDREGEPAALVCRAGDADSLRKALEQALAQPDRVAALGRRAAEIVAERYNWDDATRKLETVYAELMR